MNRIIKKKCVKCGTTDSEPNIIFHRFPTITTAQSLLKARVWAEYCFGQNEWTPEDLQDFHRKHKLLCSKHFSRECYTNGNTRRITQFAIPDGTLDILGRLRAEIVATPSEEQKRLMSRFPAKPGRREKVVSPVEDREILDSPDSPMEDGEIFDGPDDEIMMDISWADGGDEEDDPVVPIFQRKPKKIKELLPDDITIDMLNETLSKMDGSNKIEIKLTGDTLGERHKKLNELVREISEDKISIENLKENMYKMKQIDLVLIGRLANYRKNPYIICELLKSNDSMVVSVALQSKWFFTANDNMANTKDMANVKYFQNEIFPHASYHTVCRIVSTFSACLQNEIVAHDFYNYIHEWYGKKLAIKLLPKCNFHFIRTELMSALFDIPCAQVYSIYKKDKILALEYLEKYLKQENKEKLPSNYSLKTNYDKIWIQLAEDDPGKFYYFLEKYHKDIHVHLGHRIVKEVLKVCREHVVENPDKYERTIPKNEVMKILKGDDLEKFLLNCLPVKEQELSYCNNDFRNLKPKYRLNMLRKLYPIKYNGKEFLHREDFENWGLANYLSKEERIKWAGKKILEIKPKDQLKGNGYLRYMDGSSAIKRLKSLCHHTTEVSKRSKYLEYIIEYYKNNNDKEGLFQLLKLVSQRHRNENIKLRETFIRDLRSHFKLFELSSECWEMINEMLEFIRLEKENDGCSRDSLYFECLQDYTHHCLLNGNDFEQCIDKIMKLDSSYVSIWWNLGNKDFQLKIFNMIVEKYSKILVGENTSNLKTDSEAYKYIHKLLESCNSAKISMVEYPWLIQYIESNFHKWSAHERKSLLEFIKKDSKTKQILVKKLFTQIDDKNVIQNCVHFSPNIIIDNIEHFIKITTVFGHRNENYHRMYEKIQTYFMNNLGKKLAESLEQNSEKDDIKESKQLAINMMYLCYLKSPKERTRLIKPFKPKTAKVDLAVNRREYENGEIIGKYMKTFNPSVKFSTLISFVVGDFVKFSIGSLSSLNFTKPLKESHKLLDSLLKNQYLLKGVKKEGVRLAFVLFPRKDILPLYKLIWKSETNYAPMKDVLFSFTFKLLTTEENMENYKEIWEALKCFLTSLNANDLNIFKYLSKPHEIVPAFLNDYCETCWKTLKDLTSQKANLNVHIIDFTKNLHLCVAYLNDDFSEKFIKEYLKSSPLEKCKGFEEIFTFLAEFLVKANDLETQQKRNAYTFELMKNYIKTKWRKKTDDTYKHRTIIKNFVLKCCSESLNSNLKVNPTSLLWELSQLLTSTAEISTSLKLHVIINATICYKVLIADPKYSEHCSDSNSVSAAECELFECFGWNISDQLNNLCSQYGTAIVPTFSQAIINLLSELISDDTKRSILELYFILGLLKETNKRQECYLIAIEMIPARPLNNEIWLYDKIVTKIILEGDSTVKIILNEKIE